MSFPQTYPREVMSVRQAAAYLQISADTLYTYAAKGKVPGFKLGNRWRFKKSRLDEWIEEQVSDNANRTGHHQPEA